MKALKTMMFALTLLMATPLFAAPSPSQPLNLNKASAEQLATLPGIGAAKAKAIVDYRKQHGPFKSVEELTKVKGIGKKLLAKEQKYLTVNAPMNKKMNKKMDKKTDKKMTTK